MQNETFTDINGFCPILFRQKELLMSIDGVGRVAAANMIITTEAFTHFDAALLGNIHLSDREISSLMRAIEETCETETRAVHW